MDFQEFKTEFQQYNNANIVTILTDEDGNVIAALKDLDRFKQAITEHYDATILNTIVENVSNYMAQGEVRVELDQDGDEFEHLIYLTPAYLY
tara:strand:+ start:182 stop:457 length:276 start_codon:yes stop_codon:yes gene_type:complete